MQSDESRTQDFPFSAGPKSNSIYNAVPGQLPKRLLFTMMKNEDFLGSLDTNPYNFSHFNFIHFTLVYNGKPIPNDPQLEDLGLVL